MNNDQPHEFDVNHMFFPFNRNHVALAEPTPVANQPPVVPIAPQPQAQSQPAPLKKPMDWQQWALIGGGVAMMVGAWMLLRNPSGSRGVVNKLQATKQRATNKWLHRDGGLSFD